MAISTPAACRFPRGACTTRGVVQRFDLLPSASMRPATSRTRARGTNGCGRRELKRIGCGTARRCSSNRSRKPDGDQQADARALALDQRIGGDGAAVRVDDAEPDRCSDSAAWISSMPLRMLAPGREGVLGTLKQCSSPASVINARSVNVPPTSVPSMLLALMMKLWPIRAGCQPHERVAHVPSAA